MSYQNTIFKWLVHGRRTDTGLGEVGITDDGRLRVSTDSGITKSWLTQVVSDRADEGLLDPYTLWEMAGFNDSALSVYLQVYDRATHPSGGATTHKWVMRLPPQCSFNRVFPDGEAFTNGICWCVSSDPDTYVREASGLCRVELRVSAP